MVHWDKMKQLVSLQNHPYTKGNLMPIVPQIREAI
jgi:hypothetical protein